MYHKGKYKQLTKNIKQCAVTSHTSIVKDTSQELATKKRNRRCFLKREADLQYSEYMWYSSEPKQSSLELMFIKTL